VDHLGIDCDHDHVPPCIASIQTKHLTKSTEYVLTLLRHCVMVARMKEAFAYLRVSGRGQIDGDGFVRQEDAVRRYAAANGFDVVRVFREEGVSGTKDLDSRPALLELLEAAKESDGTVIIEKLDRLARDLMVSESILADFRRKGITVISVAEPDLCSNEPTRILMRQMMSAFAQYEKSMIVLKLRGARQRMKAKAGRCEGRKAYGTREGESAVIERMQTMRRNGMPWATIADSLNTEGTMSRAGRWHANSVRRTVLAMAGTDRSMTHGATS
jgi:DNA invertase Pin-like site-specific DNA recombinase